MKISKKKSALHLLNLGCGEHFHVDWVNIDISPSHPEVLDYDLRLGIPFADNSFDVIYHSHALEHMEPPWAERLLRECCRTLKPGGLLRVVVPDNEIPFVGLLRKAGFAEITRQSHDASLRHDVLRYRLDTLEDGSPRKPDSLFMEAVKPSPPAAGAQPLRVALFCTYDHGGAGTAALRLHNALRNIAAEGVISQFYCASQKTMMEGVHLAPVFGQNARGRLDGSAVLSGLEQCNRACTAALKAYPNRPVGREYFSLPQLCCDPAKMPLFEDFDLVHLHWTTHMLDPALAQEVLRGRPVVWTLHDMAPFTGGCHYSAGCTRFTKQCGRCPGLGSDDPGDLSFQTWRARMGTYRTLNLHIVCPSDWLAGEAQKSTLLGRFPIRVIPYAQPLDIFRPLNRTAIRSSLGFGPEELVLLFASQSLSNERKGGVYLLETLRRLAALPPAVHTRLILIGNNPPAEFLQTGLRAEAAGHVDAPEHMAALYNAADAVLVPSLEDNSPNVICEALGCGTPVVAFAAGGIPEMVRDGETGRLALVRDAAGLLAGLEWAAGVKNDTKIRLQCRAFALEKWHAPARARDYVNLYRKLDEQPGR